MRHCQRAAMRRGATLARCHARYADIILIRCRMLARYYTPKAAAVAMLARCFAAAIYAP